MNENKKENKGYMYPNSNKTKPTQPDFTGTVNVEGKDFKISAWKNKSSSGVEYFSISVSTPLEGAANGNKSFANSSSNANKATHQYPTQNNESSNNSTAPSTNDLDDLDAILRSGDDDPFN